MRRATIIVLAALASALPFQQGVRAAVPLGSRAQSTVLFHWTIPKKGHVGAWQAKNGVLSYNGGAVSTALPRYTVPAHTGFAVQAMLRTSGPGTLSASLNGFGLVARETRADPHTSVLGGSFFDADFQTNEEDNMPELYWNEQTIGQQAFQPGTAWHLYRLEVQGDQYSLSIDGKLMVTYSIPDYPNPTSVGVFSWYYAVQVKRFEVDAIGPPTSTTPFDPVPRDANLTVSDLPTTGFYQPYLHHWYSLEEVARENERHAKATNIDPALYQSPGRGVGYGVEYQARSRELDDLYSAIIPFDTAADALASLTARQSLERLLAATLPNPTNVHDLSTPGLGDASWGIQADAAGSGITERVTVVALVRGHYMLFLVILSTPSPDFAPDAAKTAALALSLAGIVDSRLPRT